MLVSARFARVPRRILLSAIREAVEHGRPLPHVVPVGLHYSESQRFRERAAVVIERAMDIPNRLLWSTTRSNKTPLTEHGSRR